ncbi:MAG: heavy metal-binding domain-containing protein [Phenylobacterium sp.]
MIPASRRRFLQIGLIGAGCACMAAGAAFAADAPSPTGKYVCPPCGCSADGKEFDAPGVCPACGMPLIPKPADPPKSGAPTPPKAGAAEGGSFAAAAPVGK